MAVLLKELSRSVNIGALRQRLRSYAEESPAPGKRRLLTGLLVTMALSAAGLAVFSWWQYANTHEETDDAYIDGHATTVSARIAGVVAQVFVDDNQPVQAGQLLARLDPIDYQLTVAQSRAAVDLAKNQLDQAIAALKESGHTAAAQKTQAQGELTSSRAGVSVAQSSVAQAQAAVNQQQDQIKSGQARLREAQTDLGRYQNLYAEGAVSRQQLDQSRTTYDVASADLQGAQQMLRQLQWKVQEARDSLTNSYGQLRRSQGSLTAAQATQDDTDVKKEQIDIAAASLEQAKAKLHEDMQQLAYTEIRSPISGRIGRKSLEVGQRVDAGQSLLSVFAINPWVTANFKETQVGRMLPGQDVDIKIDSFPAQTFRGKVDSIAPASGAKFALLPPENATGNFTKVVQRIPVKVTIDPARAANYLARMAPGMSAIVSVHIR